MDIKHILKEHAYRNIPANYAEAFELGLYTISGCDQRHPIAQIQSIATLSALHNVATYAWRNNGHSGSHCKYPASAAEQIAGICAAVFEEDIGKSEFGFLRPNVPFAMDNCGMGGDLVVTANVSTIAALVAAAAGIHMCKHGSPANADAGRHGSSDFIKLLGINEFSDKDQVERAVSELCFGYTEALDTRYKRIHRMTHEIAFLPHMNDIIGPITNPLSPSIMTRRVVGVNHVIPPRVVAEAYQIMNQRGVTNMEHLLVIRGYLNGDESKGVDELSTCPAGTQVAELRKGEIVEYRLYAEDFGLKPADPAEISPPPNMSKGEFSLGILKGEVTGAALEMVLANAALLFYLAGKSSNHEQCYRMAKDVFESGGARKKAEEVRRVLNND